MLLFPAGEKLGVNTRNIVTLMTLVSLVFLIIPVRTEAGIFSVISSKFLKKSKDVEELNVNSQILNVLDAPLNLEASSGVGGGDIAILEGTALLSEVGPEGTMADIGDIHTTAISIYKVRKGDTLDVIAKIFGISSKTIMWANNLSSGALKEGQELIILPIDGIRHIVEKGDTLASIAKKYKGDIDDIVLYNNLVSTSSLEVGLELIIPNGEPINLPKIATKPKVRGTDGPLYEGYYAHPVPGGRKTQGLHGFNAVDIGLYLGAPIYAAAEGQVIVVKNSGWNGGYGKYIVIAHPNGTQTLYAHNLENLVTEGMYVSKGQQIALMGSTGKSTGPHLHFEIRGAKNPF